MQIRTEVFVWNSKRFIARQFFGAVPVAIHVLNVVRHVAIGVRVLIAARRHRTVYLQKVILPRWFIRALKHGGRRLVFDYDDALYALGPGQQQGPRALLRRRRLRRFTACLAAADLVVVENEPNRAETERHCRHTLIITGPIDTDRYYPLKRPASAERAETVLGWIGSPSTTPYLRVLEPVFRDLARRHAIAVHLIGAAMFEVPGVTVRRFPWHLESEVANLASFDIGLMPLPDDPWSRGKGGYKILQYMAMGIPPVASPVGVNTDLVRHGRTGLLAAGLDEWTSALEQLIQNRSARETIGQAARADVVNRFSLVHYAPLFVQALLPPQAADAPVSLGIEGVRS
jgi:glycosyltransferase involved in cell wall biosynthesis